MKKSLQHTFRIFALATIFVASLSLMSFDDTKDFETAKNLDIFYTLFSSISNSYVDEIAPGDLMTRTITEMLKTLDPYTNFIPEADVERYTIASKGEYGGIGASVTPRDGALMIMVIRENSPAHKAGLLLGDRIIEVDEHSILNKPMEESNQLLQGEAGSILQLVILRNGERKKISIERENIKINSVPYYCMISPEIGYVKLNEFSQNCSADVLTACKTLKSQNAKSLVLDLRDNPGGLLIEAIKIVNMFVAKGERIVYTKGQNKTENAKFSTLADPFDTEIPVVVLVNDRSASAAEIVAGALQDLDRAVIIGNQTFGKGLVQTRKELAHNCLLKVTTAKYYIPSGRCIQRLNYTKRDANGNPTVVPDSLQKTFFTRNHRPVKDGGGIIPDVILPIDSVPALLSSLKESFVFFDYINKNYSYRVTTHIRPQSFSLTEKDFLNFQKFCKQTKYSYTSASEKLLDSIALKAKKEQLNISLQLQTLRQQIDEQQANIFDKNKQQISKELESFIIRNLYFERGQVEFLIRNDSSIAQAQKYLTNKSLYNTILGK